MWGLRLLGREQRLFDLKAILVPVVIILCAVL
jgi:hypothetical protein